MEFEKYLKNFFMDDQGYASIEEAIKKLDEKTKLEMEEARKEVRKGKVISHEEAKKIFAINN